MRSALFRFVRLGRSFFISSAWHLFSCSICAGPRLQAYSSLLEIRKGYDPTLSYEVSFILESVATVYVQLLHEGTVVYRPAPATFLDSNTAKLLIHDEYDPDDEEWEFKPGSVVRVETKELQGGPVPVAVALHTGERN